MVHFLPHPFTHDPVTIVTSVQLLLSGGCLLIMMNFSLLLMIINESETPNVTRNVPRTSVQAPGEEVPLAGGALDVRSGSIDQGTGLPCLGLGPTAVPEL